MHSIWVLFTCSMSKKSTEKFYFTWSINEWNLILTCPRFSCKVRSANLSIGKILLENNNYRKESVPLDRGGGILLTVTNNAPEAGFCKRVRPLNLSNLLCNLMYKVFTVLLRSSNILVTAHRAFRVQL